MNNRKNVFYWSIMITIMLVSLDALANGPSEVTLVPVSRQNPQAAVYNFFNTSGKPAADAAAQDITFDEDGKSLDAGGLIGGLAGLVDLGEKSCADVGASGQNVPDRKSNPFDWLVLSDAMAKARSEGIHPKLNIEKGHCYLLYSANIWMMLTAMNTSTIVYTLFHVKDFEANKSVTLDEIDTIGRFTVHPTAEMFDRNADSDKRYHPAPSVPAEAGEAAASRGAQ